MIARIAALFFACALGAAPALAQTKGKPSRAEVEVNLKKLFPAGHSEGREGVMKLGGQFRTVALRTWQQCRETCLKNPAEPGGGCVLWTFVKAQDAKMPNVCRMWWELPEVRDNTWAISGVGKFK